MYLYVFNNKTHPFCISLICINYLELTPNHLLRIMIQELSVYTYSSVKLFFYESYFISYLIHFLYVYSDFFPENYKNSIY
jgi:hypothetical protein